MSPASAPMRWLAVGTGSARALRDHIQRQGDAGFSGQADILQVRNVHAALEALHDGPVSACVVSATALDARPTAALRVLQEQLAGAPLLMVDCEEAAEARDAARSLGVPLWEAAHAAAGAVSTETAPPPAADTPAAGVPPSGSTQRVPGTNAVRPLPRADADVQALEAANTQDFAGGCLERVERWSSLIAFILDTLNEASSATRISLMLSESQRRSLRLHAGHGVHESLIGSVRCPLGSGIAGRAAALGRITAGHGSTGGPRGYAGSAYVVLPLGQGRKCEGVVNITGLPGDALPSSEVLKTWAELGKHAGFAISGARNLRRARLASNTDTLTGLPNRRAFEGALKRELERARRGGSGLAVGVCDVDLFKGFNDRYGHLIGDEVLREVARRLQGAFRETDLVARWGGEEFAVLLPSPTPEEAADAHGVLDRARQAVGNRPFALSGGFSPARVTISGGLAIFDGGDISGPAFVKSADEALYRAKSEGRNRIVSN